MKVYGRVSKPRVFHEVQRGRGQHMTGEQSQSQFSSDDESEQRDVAPSRDKPQRENDDVFGFLDPGNGRHTRVNRGRRRRKRTATLVGEDSPDEETLAARNDGGVQELELSVESFLDGVQRRTASQWEQQLQEGESSFLDKFLEGTTESATTAEVKYKGTPEAHDKKMYNNTRTILVKRDDEFGDGSEQEGEDEGKPDNSFGANSFHELRNLGHSLKYRQDLEFLLTDCISHAERLLNVNLSIRRDNLFKEYLSKHHANDIWGLCFNEDAPSPELDFLKGTLLSELKLRPTEIRSWPTFSQLITRLSNNYSKPNGPAKNKKKKTSKMVLMNYNEFYSKSHFDTSLDLALDLLQYYHKEVSLGSELQRNILVFVSEHPEREDTLVKTYSTLSNILLDCTINDSSTFNFLLEVFTKNLPTGYANPYYSQGFILLTNRLLEEFKMTPQLADQIALPTFSLIVADLLDGESTIEQQKTNVCQLALCLNVLDYCDIGIKIEQWSKVPQILSGLQKQGADKFLVGLFALTVSLVSIKSLSVHPTTPSLQELLRQELHSLKIIAKDNKSVSSKVEYALGKLCF
ncbi:Rad61p KNAG_0H01440 [Huiozyma naganishii CBS 8797]|uniref:Rad61 Wapl domain-containing protein n=1 Tax=Huiozyma naganishii (strain ATCC MYA-139 / BCRC 22969 / CBS 8797 / KCTC 17520 / NBRC 10181 / NCYC 3082 / Yp74L-3) TaxID=1071383 RepID=J7S1P7_HUIN7|nr:hypothetical protein KNAG_0H01440 [Kazachstania naganishii CBS 8797]CCK71557.1 hypothetical protein KNAG_0H01440 [Kazachstania naganishii CBS 8797]